MASSPGAFKDRIDRRVVEDIATRLDAVGPFDRTGFVSRASQGLGELELKARVIRIADALRTALDPDLRRALDHLVAALPPPLPSDRGLTDAMWIWPFATVVERHGLDDPTASLAAMHAITQRFSAEFAIRPFLARDPDAILAAVTPWTRDASLHVRRLVSEGTRPRLPWGLRLDAFVADPTRTVPLLERLVDDPEPYVRRSVANHLGDIAKDHPEHAVAVARRWLGEGRREPLVRHGLRWLVKQGHPGALALFGVHPPEIEVVTHVVSPAAIALGESVSLAVTLTSRSSRAQKLVVDVVLGWTTARGKPTSRVVKGTSTELGPRATWSWTKTLPIVAVSTRRAVAGEHTVSLRINGETVAPRTFTLSIP